MIDNTVDNKRIRYLDIAKGISLLLVLVSHSCGMPFELNKFFFGYYISIFFIISGIVYTKGRTIKENIQRRFYGVIIPYIGYNVLIVIYNIAVGKIETIENMIEAVIGCVYSRYCLFPINQSAGNVIFLQYGNSPMWFLTAMFLSSCIFYMIVDFIDTRKKRYIYCIFLIGMSIVLNYFPILLPWSLDTTFLGAFFMLIGFWGKELFKKTFKIIVYLGAIVIYILCCYLNGTINLSIRIYGDWSIGSVILVCAIGIIGSFLCINISHKIESFRIISGIFEFIGKHTIIILALHVNLFDMFDKILSLTNIQVDRNAITYYGFGGLKVLLTICVCAFFAYLWKRLFEIKNIIID